MTQSLLTRREVLAVSAGAALSLAGCRPAPYRRSDFLIPAESPLVALAAPDYAVDFAELITRGLRELQVDLRGKRVLVEAQPRGVRARHGDQHPSARGGWRGRGVSPRRGE